MCVCVYIVRIISSYARDAAHVIRTSPILWYIAFVWFYYGCSFRALLSVAVWVSTVKHTAIFAIICGQIAIKHTFLCDVRRNNYCGILIS